VRGLTPLPWGFASRTRLTSGHTRPGIRGSDQEYRIASSRSFLQVGPAPRGQRPARAPASTAL